VKSRAGPGRQVAQMRVRVHNFIQYRCANVRRCRAAAPCVQNGVNRMKEKAMEPGIRARSAQRMASSSRPPNREQENGQQMRKG